MNDVFTAVNDLFAVAVDISNFLWNFPTQFAWFSSIPVIGQFTLPVFLLVGIGVYFSIRTRFVQLRFFTRGVKVLFKKKAEEHTGISPMASFMLSTAMRVGAGNIVGVTGAISTGGPGALFWMWVAAFFGMATSFIESTLSQLFKEKEGNEYVGGLTHYAQRIFGNLRIVGIVIAVLFFIYRLDSVPVHTFHLFTAAASMATSITGEVYSTQSPLYYALAVVIVVSLGFILFGGMSRVTRVTDKMVPVMAVGYLVLVMILVVCNVTSIPAFFASVIGGAFKPDAIFGGMFGIALIQGIKRGLLSNEAGMGTATMAAAVADNDHPVEQGFIQVFSVFIDTIIICTLTGFVVCMAALWADPSVDWATLSNVKIDIFLQSIEKLMPGNTFLDNIAVLFASLAYGLFGFTTLLGGIVFCEISATKITGNPKIRYVVRFLGAFVFCPIGCITVISGLQLDNLWGISDLNNVVFVFINVITIFVGAKYAFAALKDYVQTEGAPFTEDRIGLSGTVWTKDRK